MPNPSNSALKTPKNAPKGKPLGIPAWGWIVAVAIGIIVGYVVLKRSPSSNAAVGGTEAGSSDSSPDTEDSASNSPGDIALPLDILQALGLRPSGGGASAGTSSSGAPSGGDSSSTASTNLTSINPDLPVGTVVPASGTGDPFTGGAPGGVITTDPEHNAFVVGTSDIDPFGGFSNNIPLDPAIQNAINQRNANPTQQSPAQMPGNSPAISQRDNPNVPDPNSAAQRKYIPAAPATKTPATKTPTAPATKYPHTV